METKIYILVCPIQGHTRYVGKTTKPDPIARLRQHQYSALIKRTKNHTCNWIRELWILGKEPIMQVIEICGDNWEERERYWIAYYRNCGFKLTNITDGGGGTKGFSKPHTEETREKMSVSQRAKAPPKASSIEARAEKLRGKKRTPEQRARMAEAARKRWEDKEQREKHSKMALNRTPEHAANLKRAQQLRDPSTRGAPFRPKAFRDT